MRSIPFGKPIISNNVNKIFQNIINSGLLVHGPYQKNLKSLLVK